MKKSSLLERMSPKSRRRFLKWMGAALAAPAIPPAVRYAANELAGGTAHADGHEASLGTLFVELDLRDQWDQGHVFVAPGLATYTGLRKGEQGDAAALFYTADELYFAGNRVYLTGDSRVLEPHLADIAFIDTCEPSRGPIHGHEAGNALRSPGRTENSSGMMPMFENDPASSDSGNVLYYGSTPTPASLHNYHQKTLDPTLRNGIAFKGISRSAHTVYHFGAGLAGAELDRVRSRTQLFETFPSFIEDLNVVPTAEEAEALTEILRRVDSRFLGKRRYDETAITNHRTQITQAREVLHVREPRLVSVPLTPEEEAYWSAEVPNQMCTRSDEESFECGADAVKGQIWEQCAWATKILTGGLTRTVALEFDYMDLHGFRPEIAVRTQARQLSYPLARMIEQFKAAGVWHRTLIAVYCADGSRSPAANSYGHQGKNTIILAGGMIRGGYYGDISVAGNTGDGHNYAYHIPDPVTGAPLEGRTGTDGRLSSAAVWRTVMKAAGVPDGLCASFSEVAGARPLDFLLRA